MSTCVARLPNVVWFLQIMKNFDALNFLHPEPPALYGL